MPLFRQAFHRLKPGLLDGIPGLFSQSSCSVTYANEDLFRQVPTN
jgi:hypothetical protein